jgi:hypothetical protein
MNGIRLRVYGRKALVDCGASAIERLATRHLRTTLSPHCHLFRSAGLFAATRPRADKASVAKIVVTCNRDASALRVGTADPR